MCTDPRTGKEGLKIPVASDSINPPDVRNDTYDDLPLGMYSIEYSHPS
jgi:hypothetical protein